MTSEIEESINQTLVPGRYQTVLNEPLVIVDGAHNVQAMTNFYRYLLGLVKGDATKIHFLVTMMRDKDVREVLDVIAAADVTLTTIASPRAAQKKRITLSWQLISYHLSQISDSHMKSLGKRVMQMISLL
nr:cyanophycin synthetase [Amylolactobacillus amylophilus]